MPITEAFGRAVREKRLARKLTQQQLADRIEKPREYISDVERGRWKTIDPDIADSIAKALGCKIAVLLQDE